MHFTELEPDTTGPRNVSDTAAVSLTSEQTEIRAWFRAHQDRVCQLDDGFIRWLSRLLDQNRITPAEMAPLRMLTYRYQDYAQHGSVDTREEVFYVLPLPHFRKTAQIPQSEPPAPRRAFPGHPTIGHFRFYHAFLQSEVEELVESADFTFPVDLVLRSAPRARL